MKWRPFLTWSYWMLLNHRQNCIVNHYGIAFVHQCRAPPGKQTEKRRRSIKSGKIIWNWTAKETTMSMKECYMSWIWIIVTADFRHATALNILLRYKWNNVFFKWNIKHFSLKFVNLFKFYELRQKTGCG